MLKTVSFSAGSFSGVLGVPNGGTGLTSLTAGYIPYGNGTGAFNSSSVFTFNGTQLSSPRLLAIGDYSTNAGDITLTNTNGGRSWRIGDGIGGYPTSLIFWDSTGAAVRMAIGATGGVSIGNTTDPGATNLSVTGSLTLAGGTPLTNYTEGSWTPVITSSVGTITSYTATGTYTRTGRTVYVAYNILISNNGTGAGYIKCDGLPFTIGTFRAFGVGAETDVVGFGILSNGIASTTYAYLTKYDGALYPGGTSYRLQGSFTYSV